MARGSSKRRDADAYVKAIIAANPNMLVPHYLMACYLYYKLDRPIISDDLFDAMSKELLAKWDTVEHMHKHLIVRDDLVAGTGFAIKYTHMIVAAARSLQLKFDRELMADVERWADEYAHRGATVELGVCFYCHPREDTR